MTLLRKYYIKITYTFHCFPHIQQILGSNIIEGPVEVLEVRHGTALVIRHDHVEDAKLQPPVDDSRVLVHSRGLHQLKPE